MTECVVLGSGFITPKVQGLIVPEKLKRDITPEITKPYKQVNSDYYIAKDLNTLYRQFLTDARIIKDFDFRDQYIKEVVRLIDGVSFKDWVYRQSQSTYLSTMGFQFLLDTLSFIMGRPRSIDIMNWSTIVEAQKDSVNRTDVKKLLECYFRDRIDDHLYKYGTYVPVSLTDVFQAWVSQPNGYKDLIVTTGIIFGDHRRMDFVSSSKLAGDDESWLYQDLAFDRRA